MRLLLLPLLLALSRMASAQQAPAEWDARLSSVSGEVTVALAEHGGSEVAAEAGMPLGMGDVVRTGKDGEAEIALEADSLLELGPGARLEVGSLSLQGSSFSLLAGRLIAKLRSALGLSYSVRTPTAVAAIRGTEFGVEVFPSEGTSVGVFDEGRVAVSPAPGAPKFPEAVLRERQETVVDPRAGGGALRVAPLRRFAGYGERVRRLRHRRAFLRRNWRRFSPGQRALWRQKMLQRFRGARPGPGREREPRRIERFRRRRGRGAGD